MRFFFIFALALITLMSFVQADLVCGSKYCDTHPCKETTPTSSTCKAPAQYRAKHSGQCGCCPSCVTLLKVGERCLTYSKELGETPAAICSEGLRCVSGTCQKLAPRV